jgi:hypothetical protein
MNASHSYGYIIQVLDICTILTPYSLFYGYVCKSVSSTDDFVIPAAFKLGHTNADILCEQAASGFPCELMRRVELVQLEASSTSSSLVPDPCKYLDT